MKSAIYMIKNNINNRIYIGQSINVKARLANHKCLLKKGKHSNSYLQNQVNKYGMTNFTFKILEYVEISLLDERECYWIKKFHTMDRNKGYNLESGGNEGKIISEETRLKKIGKNNPMYGKHHSNEAIERIRAKNRGLSDKLDLKDVENIKKRLSNGEKQNCLAKEFKVELSTINKIAKCKNWAWVMPNLNIELIKYRDNEKKKRNNTILTLHDKGLSNIKISNIINCDRETVSRVLKENNISYEVNLTDRNNNIINDFKNNLSPEEIMKKYRISKKIYNNVTFEVRKNKKNEIKKKAITMREKGMSVKDIAQVLNLHRTTITEMTKHLLT